MLRTGVPIRTVKYLSDKDAALPGAFISAKDEQIPIEYQYCQTRKPNESSESELIGYATNFRVDGDMMVCDVEINDWSMVAYNFQDVIDNYTIHVYQPDKTSELVFRLTRLLVYNKQFKTKRDSDIIDSVVENNLKGELTTC